MEIFGYLGLPPERLDKASPAPWVLTLPSEAATDPDLVRWFVQRGMNVAWINCAHDDDQAWRAMARNVRDAATRAGTTCRVAASAAVVVGVRWPARRARRGRARHHR